VKRKEDNFLSLQVRTVNYLFGPYVCKLGKRRKERGAKSNRLPRPQQSCQKAAKDIGLNFVREMEQKFTGFETGLIILQD
jgi:hypothetical protein